MKKQLSSVLLAVSIFSLNAIPAQANNNETLSSTQNSESNINSGEWCFELPWMGFFCYEL